MNRQVVESEVRGKLGVPELGHRLPPVVIGDAGKRVEMMETVGVGDFGLEGEAVPLRVRGKHRPVLPEAGGMHVVRQSVVALEPDRTARRDPDRCRGKMSDYE